ncbi:MAG: hypothetical protein JO036_21045 [Candidatus Eremiobacteraeota bacterium]|nr:hypothetical protein [Candidatus Eremiobacteraeota bacterium]
MRVIAHGCVDAAVPAMSGVRVLRGTVPARHVTTAVHYAVLLPAAAERLDAVAYLLPGRSGTSESEIAIGLGGFYAAYLRDGGAPFALAIVDSGETYYHPRAAGEDRLAVATTDFPRVVRELLGTAQLREALLGESMCGYGALLAAEREPQRFRAVAVAGPAIFPSYAEERGSVGDAFDSASDFARYDLIAHAGALRGRPVQVWCGRNDPFLPGVQAFARACPTADVQIHQGCHDDGSWRASAPSRMEFVGRHLARAR